MIDLFYFVLRLQRKPTYENNLDDVFLLTLFRSNICHIFLLKGIRTLLGALLSVLTGDHRRVCQKENVMNIEDLFSHSNPERLAVIGISCLKNAMVCTLIEAKHIGSAFGAGTLAAIMGCALFTWH